MRRAAAWAVRLPRGRVLVTALPKPTPRIRQRKRLVRNTAPIRRRVTLASRRRAVKVAGGIDPDTWAAICDSYTVAGRVLCAYGCGREATQQEHVIPIARGGQHSPGNLVPACWPCNAAKGTQTWEPAKRHPFMERSGDTCPRVVRQPGEDRH